MKLSDLGLKSKPQTKYFEGGWISFSTSNDELYYAICVWSKDRTILTIYDQGVVRSKISFDMIMQSKTFSDVRSSVV